MTPQEIREYNYPGIGRFTIPELQKTLDATSTGWSLSSVLPGNKDQVVRVIESLRDFCAFAIVGRNEFSSASQNRNISALQASNLAKYIFRERTPEEMLTIVNGASRAFNSLLTGDISELKGMDIAWAKFLMAKIEIKMPKIYAESSRLSALFLHPSLLDE